jgi:dihydroneopterin aldolase/2-amino-4-hydroxy-6-hydroxymethyldihydropteridine diphosphokinase
VTGDAPDRIAIRGLRGHGRHGVFASERETGQTFVVDLVISLDTRPAASSDDLAATVHYGIVAERVVAEIEGEPVDLIETLAQRIADRCLEFEGVGAVEVTVHKPEAPVTVPFDDVSVTIVRRAVRRLRAVLSLGSNLGDRLATLQTAVNRLAEIPESAPVAVSPVYETAPVGGPPQPDYLNAVVLMGTSLAPRQLLDHTQAIEAAAGRERSERWGPRTLDVDLVAVGDRVEDSEGLTLPHPRAYERGFVLVPWADVDPEAVLPGGGPVRTLLAALDATGVHRRDDLRLDLP